MQRNTSEIDYCPLLPSYQINSTEVVNSNYCKNHIFFIIESVELILLY